MSDLFISRSKIDLYEQCQLKFDLKYIKKEQGLSEPSENQKTIFGSVIHATLEEYFKDEKKNNLMDIYKDQFAISEMTDKDLFEKGHLMLEDYAATVKNRKIIALELPFELYLNNGVPVKGVIDRVDELSETEVEITDYKTGFYHLTEEELRKDIQLGIYELVIRQKYPQYTSVKLTLNYLDYGKISIYKSDTDRKVVEDYLVVMYNKLSKAYESNKEAKPTVNKFCGYCEYRHKCNAYKDVLHSANIDDDKNFNALIAKTDGLVVDINKLDKFQELVEAKMKILKKVKDQINEYIKAHIQSQEVKSDYAKIGNTNYYLASKKMTRYDANAAMEIFRKRNIDFNRVFEVRKTEVDVILKEDKESLALLKKTANTSFSKPYVK